MPDQRPTASLASVDELAAVVALGERMSGADNERALAEIAIQASPRLLSASRVGWLTENHEWWSGGAENEVSGLSLDRPAVTALLGTTGAMALPVSELRPAFAATLGDSIVWASPLRTHRDLVGVLLCAVPPSKVTGETLLPLLAHLASHVLAGLRQAELWRREIRTLEVDLAHRTAELRRAERQIIASDRLAMLGTLIAGIGHEITNPLATAMLNNGALVNRLGRAGLPPGLLTEAQRLVSENDEALERIRDLVGELRTFGRKDDETMTALDLRPVIESSLRMCRAQLRHVELSVELPPMPAVRGSAVRLGQVFLNLIVNAVHAVAGTPRPRVEVRAKVSADAVRVAIADNGPGVPETARERIFEMFFTTKAAGEGTGLGLAIAKDIVERHGGEIELGMREGGGAVFWVVLPSAELGATLRRRPVTPSSPSIKPARRRPPTPRPALAPEAPRVLIIDDEILILRALERELDADFQVTTVSTGDDALLATRETKFDVVLCDINLVGETGFEVIRRLEAAGRAVVAKTIYMSGSATAASAPNGLTPERFVAKPFEVPALLQLLRTVARSHGADGTT